ncbi:MAG TPA: Gfo/Idh/MocA family oxidoreductase [Roseiflexaceae bacterium]|nr:Gfo/Idh/MocA family oxidoreductase [Roseiflexaceae bacterium]
MPDHVRIGVVGTSWWAELMYLPVLKRHPRAELVAVCGRRREHVDQIAQKYGIPHAFTNYREMIEQAGLHALVVSTPDDLHYPITLEALDAGLHVLCEKPLALDVAQASAMYEKAEAARVTHMVLFTYRWLPPYRYVRQLVDKGYLGRPFHCSMRYVCGFGRDPRDRWRLDPLRARGVLGDIGSHMIDLARWYLGDVAGVGAHLTTYGGRVDSHGQRVDSTNDSVALMLLFQNGAQATIQLSSVVHVGDRGQEQHVILSGEAGTLEIHQTFGGAEIYGARSNEQQFTRLLSLDYRSTTPGPADHEMTAMLAPFHNQSIGPRLFIDAIVENRTVSPSFHEGLKAQEVIDAAFESHRRGCWVML